MPELDLEALEKQKADILAARAAKAAAVAADPKLAAARLAAELEFEQAWDAAVEQYGADNVRRLEHSFIKAIFKAPHPAAFKKSSEKEGFTNEEAEELCTAMVVYPDQKVFSALASKKPGLWGHAYAIAYELAGALQATNGKK